MRGLFACTVLGAAFGIAASAGAAQPDLLAQPPNTWVKRSPLENTPVSPRMGYEGACAWDSKHDVWIRYGGHNQGGGGEQNSELWTFDPLTAKWTLKESNLAPPGVCCAQQNLFDPIQEKYIRFPAFSGNHGWQWRREIYLNNASIWTYDVSANLWRDLRPVPEPRVTGLRCASWDSDAQVVVMFGGETNHEGTRVYDPHTNTWTKMNPAREPADRSSGNMVYDSANKLHILFGAQFTDDPHTWAYDLRKNEWRDLEPPEMPPTNKNDAVMAYDSLNRVIVALIRVEEKEDDDTVAHLETWSFDVARNRWTKMNPPREPDRSGSRARVVGFAPELGLTLLENCTAKRHSGSREQQMWTYCYARPALDRLAPPKPPANVRVKTTGDGALLEWEAGPGPGEPSFEIYRGTGEQPWLVDYERIATVPGRHTSFQDKGLRRGTVYYYAVKTRAANMESDFSVRVRTQPRIMENLVASVLSKNKVELSWKPPEGEDIVGYFVERAPVEVWTEDQLTQLKSHTPPLEEPNVGAIRRIGPFRSLHWAVYRQEPTKDTKWTDTVDLTNPVSVRGEPLLERRIYKEYLEPEGKPYRYGVYAYRVRAMNALGVQSGPSPYALTIPSAPQWPYAKEDGTTCHLKWRANPEKNLKGYRVYRLDGRWDKDTISRLTPEPISATTFADKTAGKPTRRYHILAVDALGQEGFPSRPVWFDREWKRFYEPFTGEWHQ